MLWAPTTGIPGRTTDGEECARGRPRRLLDPPERTLRALTGIAQRRLEPAAVDDGEADGEVAGARTRKLMSIAGISSVVATAVIAAIGDISRFRTPDRLASYFGLTPRIRQSGERIAIHGRISKQGNAVARTMLIEAAWSAASVPGPLRAFFLRINNRKGLNVAAVATARKIAGLIWQLLTKDKPYRWARPAFVAMKMRKLELRAGAFRAHGPAGSGRDYWIKEIRHREMELVAQAEAAYARMVLAWRDRPPKPQKA